MKKLVVSFLFVCLSFISVSQTYTFDVKNYDLYAVNGFFEKDTILNNVKEFQPNVCNRRYIIDLNEKKVSFYEDDNFVEKFNIIDIIKSNSQIEIVVESHLDDYLEITTAFSIYLTVKRKKISNVCLFWYNPFNDITYIKRVN